MSSINFPDQELEAVVIDPSLSSSGFGVGQYLEQIWALSGCCKERVVFKYTTDGTQWSCDGCDKKVLEINGAPTSSMTYVTDTLEDIRWFAHRWTGIPEADLTVQKGEW